MRIYILIASFSGLIFGSICVVDAAAEAMYNSINKINLLSKEHTEELEVLVKFLNKNGPDLLGLINSKDRAGQEILESEMSELITKYISTCRGAIKEYSGQELGERIAIALQTSIDALDPVLINLRGYDLTKAFIRLVNVGSKQFVGISAPVASYKLFWFPAFAFKA